MDHWVGCVFSLHFQRKFYLPSLAIRLKARKKQSAGAEVAEEIRFPRRAEKTAERNSAPSFLYTDDVRTSV